MLPGCSRRQGRMWGHRGAPVSPPEDEGSKGWMAGIGRTRAWWLDAATGQGVLNPNPAHTRAEPARGEMTIA